MPQMQRAAEGYMGKVKVEGRPVMCPKRTLTQGIVAVFVSLLLLGCASNPRRDQALDDLNKSLNDASRVLLEGSKRFPSQPLVGRGS